MAGLGGKIAKDLKESIKARDEIRTSTLRLLTAAMQNMAIEKRQEELDDADIVKVISRQMKQRQDAIESFKKGGRSDLAEKESKEFEILKSYLPAQITEKEIEETVKRIIDQTGAASKSDFGRVMKICMQELNGRADGKIVSSVVQKLLTK